MKVQSVKATENRLLKIMAISALLIMALWASNMAFAAGTSSYSESKATPSKDKKMDAVEIALAQKNYDKALSLLTKLVETKPTNADVWNLTGFSHRKLGNYDEAKAAYEKALSIEPRHTGAMEYMGELYLTLDQPEQAKILLNRLNMMCVYNCKDRDALKKAIAAYEAK